MRVAEDVEHAGPFDGPHAVCEGARVCAEGVAEVLSRAVGEGQRGTGDEAVQVGSLSLFVGQGLLGLCLEGQAEPGPVEGEHLRLQQGEEDGGGCAHPEHGGVADGARREG